VAEEAKLGNKPSHLNAAAALKNCGFQPDTAEQMEVDSNERANRLLWLR